MLLVLHCPLCRQRLYTSGPTPTRIEPTPDGLVVTLAPVLFEHDVCTADGMLMEVRSSPTDADAPLAPTVLMPPVARCSNCGGWREADRAPCTSCGAMA